MEKGNECPYLNMYCRDETGVSIEHWRDSWSVNMHRHDYYELMVVNRGSCQHIFNDVKTLLIPGDVVIISPHKAHGYALHGEISLFNCQFILEKLDPKVIELLSREEGDILSGPVLEFNKDRQVTAQNTFAERKDMQAITFPKYEVDSSKQGILHLLPSEHAFLAAILQRMLADTDSGNGSENDSDDPYEKMRRKKYMEIILLELNKAVLHRNKKYLSYSQFNQKMIAQVLTEIEENLTEPFDIQKTACQYSFSPNYLRKLFKDFTGLTPVPYINRMRIIQACEYIQSQSMNIKEAAEQVGIYDLNYFSRLFKKIIGCAPNKI